MNIKLNKYVNHFKATSILCLCVNTIIFLSYTLLFSSLSCCKDNCSCHSTSEDVSFFYNYHYPQVLKTHSCYSLDLSSEYHNGLSCPVYCITLVSVYTPLLYVLCFTYWLCLPSCLCNTFVFYLHRGNQLWYLQNKCSYCCMLTFSCGFV